MPLRDFVMQGWSVLEPRRTFIPGWHIDAVCEHLEAVSHGDIHQLIINIPPGSSKSLLACVFWPAWEWTWAPETRGLFSSYAEKLAKRDSLRTRRLINSQWYQSMWGDRFVLSGDQNEKLRFENNRTGYRIATSVGGTGTGERADRVVVDDPHKVSQKKSDTKRDTVVEWWDEEMSTRGTDPVNTGFVVIMQRIHEKDLTGHLLEQGGWEHLMLPMEFEPSRKCVTFIGFSDPRTEPGELLSPDRFPAEEVERLKRKLGSAAAAGQLQQRPVPAEGAIFKKQWWRFWKPLYSGLSNSVEIRLDTGEVHIAPVVELPRKFDEQIQSWDLTFESTVSAVVGEVWARKGAQFFLIDETRGFWKFVGQLAELKKFSRKHPLTLEKVVEKKANAAAMIDVAREHIPGLIGIEPHGDKRARAEAVSPLPEAGNVYLPHPDMAPWVWEYIDEMAAHPDGAFDDRGDVTAQALTRLSRHVTSADPDQWPTVKG